MVICNGDRLSQAFQHIRIGVAAVGSCPPRRRSDLQLDPSLLDDQSEDGFINMSDSTGDDGLQGGLALAQLAAPQSPPHSPPQTWEPHLVFNEFGSVVAALRFVLFIMFVAAMP